jgi:adenylate kinase
MSSFMVLIGAPGAGKGTQAVQLAAELGLPHISSGDIFREHLKNHTDLGKLAQAYMDKGELVPDDVTIEMIKERLSRSDSRDGAILDGFPRTPSQADALMAFLPSIGGSLSTVAYIKVPSEVLVERLSGRWVCPKCGRVYQEHNPPRTAGVCDDDGSQLYQRPDDAPDTVKNRIDVYHRQTSPLIEYFRGLDLLVEVDGSQEIDQVTRQILAQVRSR